MISELQRTAAYLLLATTEAEKVCEKTRHTEDDDLYEASRDLRSALVRAAALLDFVTTQVGKDGGK